MSDAHRTHHQGDLGYPQPRCGICVHHVGGYGCVRPEGHNGPCRAPLSDADGPAVEAQAPDDEDDP